MRVWISERIALSVLRRCSILWSWKSGKALEDWVLHLLQPFLVTEYSTTWKLF